MMSTTHIQIENRTIAKTMIDGTELLSNELTTQLGNAVDQAEDLGPGGVMLIHVRGRFNPAALRPWPGRINIHSVTGWERVLRRIERTCSTTIVLVERACSAVALELLLVADRRLASVDFSMQHAIVGGDAWPGMALYRLARQIGDASARKLLLNGTDVDVALLRELGIVDETVDSLATGLDRISHFLTHAPLNDFAVRRRLIQDSLFTSFDDALGTHLAACDRALRRSLTQDHEFAPARDAASTV
jgi:isomerase DpgB